MPAFGGAGARVTAESFPKLAKRSFASAFVRRKKSELFSGAESHRPEQAGFDQRRIPGPKLPGGEGKSSRRTGPAFAQPRGPFGQCATQGFAVARNSPHAIIRQLFVADQAVRPAVYHGHFEQIGSGLRLVR